MSENVAIRNFKCSSYNTQPTSYDIEGLPKIKSNKVPVIRMYGTTAQGLKCVLHIHGVLPYLIVRLIDAPIPQALSDIKRKLQLILNATSPALLPDKRLNSHIYDITLLKTRSMYGFYRAKTPYARIFFNEPFVCSIFSKGFQDVGDQDAMMVPYCGHTNYIMRFFIDFNIFGFDLVRFKKVAWRPLRDQNDPRGKKRMPGDVDFLRPQFVSNLKRTAYEGLEGDVVAGDILNAYDMNETRQNPGIQAIWEEEGERCRRLGTIIPDPPVFDQVATFRCQDEVRKVRDFGKMIRTLRDKYRQFSSQHLPQTVTFNHTQMEVDEVEGDVSVVGEDLDVTKDIYDEGRSNDYVCFKNERKAQKKKYSKRCGKKSVMLTNFAVKKNKVKKRKKRRLLESKNNVARQPKISEYFLKAGAKKLLTPEEDLVRRLEVRNIRRTRLKKAEQNMSQEQKLESRAVRRASRLKKKLRTHEDKRKDECMKEIKKVIKEARRERKIRNYLAFKSTLVCRHKAKRPKLSGLCRGVYILNSALTSPMDGQTKCTRRYVGPVGLLVHPDDSVTLKGSSADILEMTTNKNDPHYFEPIVKPKAKPCPDLTPILTSEEVSKISQGPYAIPNVVLISMELIPRTIYKAAPNPKSDGIAAVSLQIYRNICVQSAVPDKEYLLVIPEVIENEDVKKCDIKNLSVCESESHLIYGVMNIVRRENPDLLVGYEMERESWGYYIKIAKKIIPDIVSKLSKVKLPVLPKQFDKIKAPEGRISLEVWSIVREDTKLRSYEFQDVVFDLMSVSIPKYSNERIFAICQSKGFKYEKVVILKNLVSKAKYNVKILNVLGTLTKTIQMAKVYGIQFEEALTRGSQYRVESMLFRATLRQNFVTPTMSFKQLKNMPSPETTPLVMEPKSDLYRDPVIVLDFQSLYPSMSIAYNYCYSTVLGKLSDWNEYVKNVATTPITHSFPEINFKLGGLTYCPDVRDVCEIGNIQQNVHITPVDTVFVGTEIRKGVLPAYLEGLLKTRVMIKSMMKMYKHNKPLYKILDARQLSLKLLANVSYGYTSANATGKMPCCEVADAIVSKGRQTLERACFTIRNECKDIWPDLEIVYGDTDSIFVRVHGTRCLKKAFEIGEKLALKITLQNPPPVQLKFEKVMMPCALITKKRYVGYSYESVDQRIPTFDAKGIETVRRDNCPFIANEYEKFIKLVFEKGVDFGCEYLKFKLNQIEKVPFKQFIMSSSFRGNYSPNSQIPAKKLQAERIKVNPNYGYLFGQRVQYVVKRPEAVGNTIKRKQLKIITNVMDPLLFIKDKNNVLNYDYYVQNLLLPALRRIMLLCKVNLQIQIPIVNPKKCNRCGFGMGIEGFCTECMRYKARVDDNYNRHLKSIQLKSLYQKECRNCKGASFTQDIEKGSCHNVSCPVYNEIKKEDYSMSKSIYYYNFYNVANLMLSIQDQFKIRNKQKREPIVITIEDSD